MQLYKPNKSVKGAALSINISARPDKDGQKGDKSFYFQLIQQVGWDEKSGNGTFKDGKKLIVKYAPHEIAGMLAAINRNISLADAMNVKYVYHDGESNSSNISFEPHFKSEKKGDAWVKSNIQQGFLYRVTRTDKNNPENKDSIAIGFNWAELELLKVFLTDGLNHICNAWYSENISRASEAKERKTASTKKSTKKEEVAQPEPETNSASDAEVTETEPVEVDF